MKLLLTFCMLLFLHGKSFAQYFFDKEYSPFSAELDKAIRSAHNQNVKSLTANYRLDDPKSGEKGKVVVTFLNDSVFELKDHDGKEQYVFRGNDYYRYTPAVSEFVSDLNIIDSADCFVIWGGSSTSRGDSYCRLQYDSADRMIDYYYTYGNNMKHETWIYEGDSAYWHNAWRNNGDSVTHEYREYVYEYYNTDSSFYTRDVRHYVVHNNVKFPNGDVYESTRTYITYDESDRVKEIRIENAEATDGKASLGVHVHVMKITYKMR